MHFLELLEQVSDRDTAVYYAKNYTKIPTEQQRAATTLAHRLISFDWELSPQGHAFWDDLCDKLRQHSFNYNVTYEPEVYEQYKNEVFEDVKAVIPNIRDYSVIIKDTSIEDRQKLHSLMHCFLDEPVYKNTRLHTDYTTEAAYFRWVGLDCVWRMDVTKGAGKHEISIQDFIAKFSKPNTTAPEEDIKVGAQYTNTTGVVCTIFEVNEGSEFANVIKYKTTKNSGGVTNRNNIRKNWTKKPDSIQNYAVNITDRSLENRLKVKDLLVKLKEPVFLKSRAFVNDKILDKSYLAMVSHEWAIGDEEDVKNKTIITIEEFIALFETEQEPKKMQHTLETTIKKDIEQTIKQTETTKKETFMSKLKTTTLNTLEQNKQAAIIAAKVDAGRIINKQVIKQLKPHVPMLLRGYLDTPLAPVIAANVVAMIGNHTDNSKVKKVSELMLLGAADATVQSFNLDKIIDDVLAGIKLPAGFLDADDN